MRGEKSRFAGSQKMVNFRAQTIDPDRPIGFSQTIKKEERL
jgi:hypothetical protein